MRELSAAFAQAGRDASAGLRGAEREAAEPVRRDAEQLAQTKIRRIGKDWWKMRVGVTRTLVYVAPRERGVKTRGADPRRRPAFADLLMGRAMQPALDQNETTVVDTFERLFDRVTADFNRGGS
jgi:hypothetical protein